MSEEKKTEFRLLKNAYFIYLAVLPALAWYGVMDYYLSRGVDDLDTILGLNVIGGLFTVVFYSVISEIVQFPKKILPILIMILDAPIQVWGLKLLGADISYLEFFAIDYFIEAGGFFTCLCVLAIFPSLSKKRAISLKGNLSLAGFLLSGTIGILLWALYYPFGEIAWKFIQTSAWYNAAPIIIAYLSSTVLYIRYMGAGLSRNNTTWIMITIGFWFLGISTAYLVLSMFY